MIEELELCKCVKKSSFRLGDLVTICDVCGGTKWATSRDKKKPLELFKGLKGDKYIG